MSCCVYCVVYLEERRVGGGSEHGISGLDDLTEGSGTGTEGHPGEGVGKRGPESDGCKFLPVLLDRVRSCGHELSYEERGRECIWEKTTGKKLQVKEC